MSAGSFSFVLHAHIPYVRRAGVWPFGEEWLFEVMADTYIPLLRMLEGLPAPKRPLLSIGVTPVLLEQLSDGYIKQRFEQYLYQRLDLCAKDMEHHRDRPQRRVLARMYERNYHLVLSLFKDHFRRDLVGAFKGLQDSGRAELLTSAATHGFLPLLGRESAVRAQVRLGVESFVRHFGRRPKGTWLPECGYRPAGMWRLPASGEEYDRQRVSRYDAFASGNKKYAERCTRPEQRKGVTCPDEGFSGDSLLAFVELGFLGHGANVKDQSSYESGNQANQQ